MSIPENIIEFRPARCSGAPVAERRGAVSRRADNIPCAPVLAPGMVAQGAGAADHRAHMADAPTREEGSRSRLAPGYTSATSTEPPESGAPEAAGESPHGLARDFALGDDPLGFAAFAAAWRRLTEEGGV